MNAIDQIYSKNTQPKAFAREYSLYLCRLLTALDTEAVSRVIEKFLWARENSKKIFFIGNGGSAATASHFANDLSAGIPRKGKPFQALSLTDNVAILTALGNDFGYEHIFVKQLEVLFSPGDLLVAISASGNSPNLIRAVDYVNAQGGETIGFVGFDGGKLKVICKMNVHIATEKGEYGPVEDMHMVLDHLMSGFLMRKVLAE